MLRFLKSTNIDVDIFDGDLILMNLGTRQVLVLNEAASILWDAIDLLNTRDDLLELLREAMPHAQPSLLETNLDAMLESLLRHDFLKAVPEIMTNQIERAF